MLTDCAGAGHRLVDSDPRGHKEGRERIESYLRSPDFAFLRIAGDMGRGNVGAAQQLSVDVGLVFPAVDNHGADLAGVAGGNEGRGVDNLASGTVDDDWSASQ